MYNEYKYFIFITKTIQNNFACSLIVPNEGLDEAILIKSVDFLFCRQYCINKPFLLIEVYLQNRSIIIDFNSMLPIVRSLSIRKFFFTVCCYSATVFFMENGRGFRWFDRMGVKKGFAVF